MSKPNASAEPSIDEILASIRRIIQEEPTGARPEPLRSPPLPAPPMHGVRANAAPAPAGLAAMPPSAGPSIFSATPVSGALPPVPPFGRPLAQLTSPYAAPPAARPAPIHDDLAELTDDSAPAALQSTGRANPVPLPVAPANVPAQLAPAAATPNIFGQIRSNPAPEPARTALEPVAVAAPTSPPAPMVEKPSATRLVADVSRIPPSADADPVGAAAARSALGALAAGFAAARQPQAEPVPEIPVASAATAAAAIPVTMAAGFLARDADLTPAPAAPVLMNLAEPAPRSEMAPAAKAGPGSGPVAAQAAVSSPSGPEVDQAIAAAAAAALSDPAGLAANASRATPPAGPATASLDDNVARLLRPMLRNWLDSNMPRIVEKALREELDDAQKKS